MTIDEGIAQWIAWANGGLDAITHACTTMLATHPEREKVLALLSEQIKMASDEPQDSHEIRNYKRGMREALQKFQHGAEVALTAEAVRALKAKDGLN